jgi:inner membrane protein
MGATPFSPPQNGVRAKAWLAVYCLVVANLPDLDFIWWNGNSFTVSGLFHHGVTHSLGFALIVGAIAGAVARLRGRKDYGKLAVLTVALYASHVLVDLLSEDNYLQNGIGLPALWPLTETYFIFPILPSVDRDHLFTLGNAKAVMLEPLLFGGVMIAVWGHRFWRDGNTVETVVE